VTAAVAGGPIDFLAIEWHSDRGWVPAAAGPELERGAAGSL